MEKFKTLVVEALKVVALWFVATIIPFLFELYNYEFSDNSTFTNILTELFIWLLVPLVLYISNDILKDLIDQDRDNVWWNLLLLMVFVIVFILMLAVNLKIKLYK